MIFRPHPFSYGFAEDVAAIERIVKLLSDDAARTGRPHRYGAAAEHDLGIIDCINLSDTMVSDVSSVVSDYLFSEKPFAMVAVPCPPEQFVAEYPSRGPPTSWTDNSANRRGCWTNCWVPIRCVPTGSGCGPTTSVTQPPRGTPSCSSAPASKRSTGRRT